MTIVAMYQVAPLEQAVQEIHKHFAAALDADGKAINHRINAGKKLLALRERIEAGEAGVGVNWWQWYESKFVRSRKDAEKVMRMASEEDPEAAAEEERAEARERGAKLRSNPIDHALRLVEKMDATQREEFFARLKEKYTW